MRRRLSAAAGANPSTSAALPLAARRRSKNQVLAPYAAYLGYQEVRQPGRPVIAQRLLRMAGIIAEFAARAPNLDNGHSTQRYMTSLAAAPAVLSWGQPAEAQARAARRDGTPVELPSTTPPPTATN